MGRISDDQAELSGRDVELGEIDSVLASSVVGIREMLSCVWKEQATETGSERVVSLVVLEPSSESSLELVSQRCIEAAQRHLPDYMRPLKMIQVDALPKSPSGRADRNAASAYVRKTLKEGDQYPRLEPTPNDKVEHARSLGDPEDTKPDEREVDTRNQLAHFSSSHMSDALSMLNLASEADIEMILPATCTQSQLAMSFAMDRRNCISHSVLKLEPEVLLETLREAIEDVVSEQAIYRCAMLPCDDSLSPFAQVILAPETWHRLTESRTQIVHRKANASLIAGDAKEWLELAEGNISLDSQSLYHIQVIESESDSDSNTNSSNLLVISVAHCICDPASLQTLMSDITRRYAGLSSIPRQSIYEVVLEWASNVDPETDKLWQESLKGWETESFGALSGNNVRPSAASTDHGRGMVQYTSDLPWHVLEEKSRALSASPVVILQASWSLLLQLFSEADTGDVTFGNVISTHHISAHGPTFSVVPCRMTLPRTQTISQLVGQLTDHSKFAQSHRHTSFGIYNTLPFNTAVALHAYPQRDHKHEHGSVEAVPVLWTEVQNPAVRYDFAVFAEVFPTDPRFPCQNEPSNKTTFKLTYREDALSELSATCIAKQLSALTETMLFSHPDDMVQTLPARLPRSLLSAEGTVQLPLEREKESGQQDYDRVELLHSQFEKQAASTPDLLALSFYTSLESPPIEISYGELDARANGLAKILREEDVDVIPICLQRGIELYVAVLAILKAGSAWCPIDETSPVQRRTSLIARTQSKVLLTTTESLPLVQPCLTHESLEGMRVILVDQYADQKTSVRTDPRYSILSSRVLTGKDLAYLLWTSGTTGEPKGVMIQHAAATQAMRDLQIQIEHDEKAEQIRTLQISAYSFDVFVQDLFYTWGLAGSVITGSRELLLSTFVEFIWKSRPTHAHLTPSFGASVTVEHLRGSTLQYVTFIGEKLTEDVAEAWAAPGITTRAYNTYGPAENAVVSTVRRFYGKSRDQAKAANVGFPLTPCTAYVVREIETPQDNKSCWELVPRYGVGELALGGTQVALGYLNNEAKTTKAFIQGGPGIDERIYLTGDMVRLNDHGFEFLGRNDDLVKIAGIRIELSEISAACASIKDNDAAVEHIETLFLLRPGADTNSSNKVVVTFVSIKGNSVDTGKIRTQVFQRARELLPTYMVPGHVVVLNTTMPRTASNKVDRKALQALYQESDLSTLAERDVSQEPSGKGQQMPLQWSEKQLYVLRMVADNFNAAIEPLLPADSLAGLGFSSLLVTKLAWTLRRQLKCAVGVVDLMRCEYLGELVDVILSKLSDQNNLLSQSNGTVPRETTVENSWVASIKEKLTKNITGDMRPHDTLYVLPATPMQESLIVETMIEPRAYWAHLVFDLNHLGKINSQRLQRAWTAAAGKFDILRTIFFSLAQLDIECTEKLENSVTWARKQGIQSTILQLVRKEPILHWTLLSSDNDQSLSRWAEELQLELTPTTTTQPPWFITFAEGDGKMMLSMHHALHDYVSSGMLLDTVAKLYQEQARESDDGVVQLAKGMELGLLPTPSQRDEAASLWNTRLHEVRKTAGPVTAPFPDLTQFRQKQTQRILISSKEIPCSALKSASASPPIPTLFQSAFGCVLASYLELNAVVFGHTVSQRIMHPELAHVMGPAIATVPVIVRADACSAQELWSDMTRDSNNLFQSTQNLHPVDIKRILNQDNGGITTHFPGLFVYHPAPEMAEGAGNNHGQQFFRDPELAVSINVEHPLALNIYEVDGTMELRGDQRHIAQAQLDLMLDQIIEQARVMVESPELPLHRLHDKMDSRLISISRGAAVDEARRADPTEKSSLHAFEHPEWIAAEEVIFLESDESEQEIVTKSITYDNLDILTNAIASRLASHEANLQPDDIVALYLSRDIKSLAATLAIFRAGYVYLPVDEDLPAARKRLLIHEAEAKLIITTEHFFGDLDLNPHSHVPALILPDGDADVDTMLSWPISQSQLKTGHGGYLLYTSGSTGRPKGVRVSNSSLCHFIAAFSRRMIESSPVTASLGGAGKYLNLTSRAFDPHLTQLFVPLYLGHRVVIGKDRTAMLGSLQQVINELGITHFGSVPSVLTQLRLLPEDVPSVRVVTTGGEKTSGELLDTWTNPYDSTDEEGQKSQQAVLFNFYGPTETTIGCLGHAVDRDSNTRNLGLPFQGLEALLLCPGTGDEQIIARRGQPGELCIAGPQVAMGYLDRPIENAKSFQTTALLGDGDKRMYRTGDMMRMMHDGTLEFLGRTDQQAKVRGQRLEIDEVVSFMKAATADEGGLDFAAAVVATGNDNLNQQQQLFGFVARKASRLLKSEVDADVELLQNPDKALTSIRESIEQKCETELPAFMVPTVLWLSKIPYQAAAGKVDTKLLAKLVNDYFTAQEDQHHQDRSMSTTPAGVDHTLNNIESVVVACVEEALGSTISATTTSSIHRLGIDSLSAVHLVSLLKRRGFSKINLASILSPRCTVGSIARSADGDLGGDGPTRSLQQKVESLQQVKMFSPADLGPLPVGLVESQIEAVLPCLPLQSALIARSLVWLSANSDDDEAIAAVDVPYVTQFQYRLAQGTDIPRWKKAAQQVVASEAMLRTCFIQREEDGQIFQVVLRYPPCSPFDGQGDPADIVAHLNVRPPIAIQVREPESSGEAIVSLRIHHALFDGTAIDVLRKKLGQAYNDPGPSSASINQSLDLITRISNHCCPSAAELASTKAFWEARLHGVRPCRIETDGENTKPDTIVRSTRSLTCTFPQLKDRLRLHAQESGVSISPSSAFQLATALSLAQLTRQSSVVYGFVMSLRPLLAHVADGVGDFVGPCLNTIVQTLSFQTGSETLTELAQRVQEAHLEISQDYVPLISVEKVQHWAQSEDKLFDSLLNINLVPADEATNRGPEPGGMSSLDNRSNSDMALAVDVDLHADGKIFLTLSSAGVLSAPQLDAVGLLFNNVVCNVADKNARVEQFVSVRNDTNGIASEDHRTPNGLELESVLLEEAYQEAAASVKRALCRRLRLKHSDISDKAETTTLYQLGLDSIAVLPFIRLINRSENIKLAPNAVIKARTIRGAARLVQEAKSRPRTSVNSNRRRIPEVKPDTVNNNTNDSTLERLAKVHMFVASPLQEGMLSASMAIASKAYTYVHTIQLSEHALRSDTASLDKFFAAVSDTVQACEILRTRFIFTQDEDAPWLGFVSPTEQSDLVSWEVAESDIPGLINLKIHHALYDATSIQAVWRILEEDYRRRLQGHDQPHEEASRYLFRPFARTCASAQRASVGFWTKLVQGYIYTPLTFPGAALQASSAFHFALDEQQLSLLQTKCRTSSVTTKAALQLAWVKVLCESLYGQADVIYGEVVSTSDGSTADGEEVTVGPTINTVPMRVNLADQRSVVDVAEALARVQKLIDDARGENAMASLRKVQTLWRSSSGDPERVPSSLFQSLFVFDGVVASAQNGSNSSTQPLFRPAQTQSLDRGHDDGPAYDDYPLIVSFQIRDNSLHGKLRAKLTKTEVEDLGRQLEAAVKSIVTGELKTPALDISRMGTLGRSNSTLNRRTVSKTINGVQSEMPSPTANAVLELMKTVLGTRSRGKDITYNTRLINVGLDSILAIRVSRLLKKQLGINASVFDIINGASVYDIVKNTASTQKAVVQKPRQQLSTQEQELKSLAAENLGLSKDLITSVLPVLAGQRAHLQQWVYNGKRFFEPPWVYRVTDNSLNAQQTAKCWAELCRIHGALRTTFAWLGNVTGLVQVTLGEQWTGETRFAVLQDFSKPIQTLTHEHVAMENGEPSDFREPPARLSFLEGSDGKAIVLRLHHALYDAWSIRIIEKDFNELLASGKVLQSRVAFESVVRQIRDIRQPDAEDSYWKQHLSHAQDTVLGHGATSDASTAPTPKSPLGPHFKVKYSSIVPQSTIEALSQIKNNARTSAAIILAYARTLGHFTKRSHPAFGLNHASRSLTSPEGSHTLDLTAASVPTLTVTPICVDLDSKSPHEASSEKPLLDLLQDHLAQLAKFAQADGAQKFGPRFNSYLNILHPGDITAEVEVEDVKAATKVLSREKLGEPLASEYFTVTEPSSSVVSTIDKLDSSHLSPHRFYFNVIVRHGQEISAAVGGDEALFNGDLAVVTKLVSYFGSELAKIIETTCVD